MTGASASSVTTVSVHSPGFETGTITVGDRVLPFPEAFDGAPLEAALGPQPVTPLAVGVERTVAAYRDAIARGLVDGAYLDRVLEA